MRRSPRPARAVSETMMAGFPRGAIDATVSPWGAACPSILLAHAEDESDNPRGVIGFLAIGNSVRPGETWSAGSEMR